MWTILQAPSRQVFLTFLMSGWSYTVPMKGRQMTIRTAWWNMTNVQTLRMVHKS